MRILWLGWKELASSRRMLEAAKGSDIQVDALEIFDVSFEATGQHILASYQGRSLVEMYDAIVLRTFHPHVSESLTLARLFHDAGRVVIDESLVDEGYAISKMHDYLRLAQQSAAVPDTWHVYDSSEVERLAAKLGYPCILKGVHGGHGAHVYKLDTPEQLLHRLWRYPVGELLLQEYLPVDEDFRVLVIGYEALPIIVSRRPEPGEFRTNFATRADFKAHSITEFPELKTLAEKGARILRREFAGVDIRHKQGEPMILEVNRQPSFEGFEASTGIDVASEFLNYIRRKIAGAR